MMAPHDSQGIPMAGTLSLAVAGIAITAIGAPLALSIFLSGSLAWKLPAAPIIFSAAIIGGISISLPAAVINAAVLLLLARFRVDALPVSLFSGALIGMLTRSFVFHDSAKISAHSELGSDHPHEFVAFVGTGALMGALYWLVAILPQRHCRVMCETPPQD
jgi:hypothetical protein